MVLSAAELLSEETAVEVLSAEEPQAASSIAQQRITGISFFMGLVLLYIVYDIVFLYAQA